MDYKKQGEDFLTATGTTLEVIETVPQIKPHWDDSDKHISYSVTLKNERGSYTFNFWGSIYDFEMVLRAKLVEERHDTQSPQYFSVKEFLKQKGQPIGMTGIDARRLSEKTREAVKPNAYDVLASMYLLYSDTFEDFCAEYGYDTDSIKAERTYKEVLQQDRMLRKLFTNDQLDQLSDIS